MHCSRGDYIKVYSEGSTSGPGPPGVNEYSSWSQLLCGSRMETPPPIYSHGPMLTLEFHTGAKETNATGFVGTYKFIDRRLFETDGVPVPDTWCDYSFSSAPTRGHGRLYSPRYPSTYPSNVRCTYHFHARQNERIKLLFQESFLQKGDER
ncbi:unnamed protein product [Plutella xylostella]|uniref:(diamondback moth) hypothetical protein n=1 Tax=Plutella xylostella TaxID=51655 RepID=A0A8S4F6H9_PLUXY|nr:unnamed protein product [Plutella xylostella]